MCFDILNDGKIITYRKKDHDFLMDIRNGKYLDEDQRVKQEFWDLADDLENKLEYYKFKSGLPENPDYERINKFLADVNYEVVCHGYKTS